MVRSSIRLLLVLIFGLLCGATARADSSETASIPAGPQLSASTPEPSGLILVSLGGSTFLSLAVIRRIWG